jgi:hypothetical protein
LFEVKVRDSRRIQAEGGEAQFDPGEPGRAKLQSVTYLVHELRRTRVEASARVDLHLDAAQVIRHYPEDLRFVERDLANGNVPIRFDGEKFEDPAPGMNLEEG